MAGEVIASHFAEPLRRTLSAAASLKRAPDEASETLAQLPAGATLDMLDNSRGWAWGYAGDDRRVGYVRSGALG
nr:SH3 domain-containing protein [Sphingomonas arenae]